MFKNEMLRLHEEKNKWWTQCREEFAKFGASIDKVFEAASLERSQSAVTIQKMFDIPGRTVGPQPSNA